MRLIKAQSEKGQQIVNAEIQTILQQIKFRLGGLTQVKEFGIELKHKQIIENYVSQG